MTRLLLRLSPLTLALFVVELALVAALGVLVVHPPEPVPRPVTYICRKSDVTCRELLAEAKAIQAAEQNR